MDLGRCQLEVSLNGGVDVDGGAGSCCTTRSNGRELIGRALFGLYALFSRSRNRAHRTNFDTGGIRGRPFELRPIPAVDLRGTGGQLRAWLGNGHARTGATNLEAG